MITWKEWAVIAAAMLASWVWYIVCQEKKRYEDERDAIDEMKHGGGVS